MKLFLLPLFVVLLFGGCAGSFGPLDGIDDGTENPDGAAPLASPPGPPAGQERFTGISLTTTNPQSGTAVRAAFYEQGVLRTVDLAWYRSPDKISWEPVLPVPAATGFLPWTEDVGFYLRVEALWQDVLYQAETVKVGDSLYNLLKSDLRLDPMPGGITDGSDAALVFPGAPGLSYKVAAVPAGNSPPNDGAYQPVSGDIRLSAACGSAPSKDAPYDVYITGQRVISGRTLSMKTAYTCQVTPRAAFSAFNVTDVSGENITNPYKNEMYRGGNSITVNGDVYAITEGQFSLLDRWCKTNPPELRRLYVLSIANGKFDNNVILTGSAPSLSLWGFNPGEKTEYEFQGFTLTNPHRYISVEEWAVLTLPSDLSGKLSMEGPARIRVSFGGELRNQASSSASNSPWTAGLENVQWTYLWGSTVYPSDYPTLSRPFIAKDDSLLNSTAVWEGGSASNESSLNLNPGARPSILLDGKVTFVHDFTAFSDWDIKMGSKITVAMSNQNEAFDFSNGPASGTWDLIGHRGPLPIANSYFMVHRGKLLSLPGIESKVWTAVTSFRWSSGGGGGWIPET
jgi:hypothetical protein